MFYMRKHFYHKLFHNYIFLSVKKIMDFIPSHFLHTLRSTLLNIEGNISNMGINNGLNIKDEKEMHWQHTAELVSYEHG